MSIWYVPVVKITYTKKKEEYDTSSDTIETPWEPVERETLIYGTPHIANVSYVTEAINPFLEVDS